MESDTVTFTPTVDALLADVNGHIAHYRELNDANAREIIEYLKQRLQPYAIKVSYEHLSCLEKINKIREDFTAGATFPEDVKSVQNIYRRFRFVLSSIRHKANFSYALVRQSNGLVCVVEELPTGLQCSVLAVPPNDFNPKYTHESLDRLIKNGVYDLYEIKDGTTATLYYDPQAWDTTVQTQLVAEGAATKVNKTYRRGKWLISTKNAIVADDMLWRGFTHRRIMDDVLAQYPDFKLSNLDPAKCYSLGFKHPAFHPYKQPQPWQEQHFTTPLVSGKWVREAWLIQSYCLATGVASTTDNCGLPWQPKSSDKMDLASMLNKAQRSLDENVANSSVVFLGYILRAQKTEDPEASDIIIESSLWTEIRKAIYQLPFTPNKEVRDKQEQNFKNTSYIVLNSFLDFRKRKMFIYLFPQYAAQYQYYTHVVNQVVKRVCQFLQKDNKNSRFRGANQVTDGTKAELTPDQKIVATLAKRFEEIVNMTFAVNADNTGRGISRHDEKMVRNLIVQQKYIDIYFQVLHAE